MLRRGMTLLELVVVLAILAVLTTVAVTLSETVIDQARFDATQRTLQNVQDAIQGPAGQQSPSGFLCDVGRLPLVLNGDPLRELWDGSGAAKTYGPQTVSIVARPTVGKTLPLTTTALIGGWRGPYLRLAPGNNDAISGNARMPDGWGVSFRALDPLTGLPLITNGAKVQVIASWGANNAADGGPLASSLDLDQFVPAQPLAPPGLPLATFLESGQIHLTVQAVNSNFTQGSSNVAAVTDPFVLKGATLSQYVCVVVISPDNAELKAYPMVADSQAPVDYALGAPTGDDPFKTTAVAGVLQNVPLGVRVVQAFQYEVNGSTVTIKKRSPQTFVTLTPANPTPNVTLILQ